MGETADALGLGPTFEFEGTTYTLSPWTYAVQAQFERYLEAQAVAAVKRMDLPDDERRDLLKDVYRDIAAGSYSFGSELVAQALRSLKHLKHLFLLALKVHHPGVTKDLVERMFERQLEELLQKMTSANADPTPGPATAPTTSSPTTPA
jgi:hypothetical protein